VDRLLLPVRTPSPNPWDEDAEDLPTFEQLRAITVVARTCAHLRAVMEAAPEYMAVRKAFEDVWDSPRPLWEPYGDMVLALARRYLREL